MTRKEGKKKKEKEASDDRKREIKILIVVLNPAAVELNQLAGGGGVTH